MKRLAAIVFCIILVFGVSGCGDKNEPVAQNTEEKATEEEKSAKEENTVSDEDTAPEEEEAVENPDELEYMTCTADELATEMYADIDACNEKYGGKYLEITGNLEAAEVDDAATPPGKVVRMKVNIEPPEINSSAMIVGYSWDEKWMTQEEYEEIIGDLAEGDEVIMRGYVTDWTFINDAGIRQCSLDLIGICKK